MVIYFQLIKQDAKDALQHKIYLMMIRMTIFLIVMDIFSRADSSVDTIYFLINYFGNFMIFALNLVIPSLWLLYVYILMLHDEIKVRRLIYVLVALNCVNVVMVVVSQFEGWLYYIDSKNIYHRGPFFLFPVLITIGLVTLSYVVIIKNRKRMDIKQVFTLAFFAVLPCVGIILQVVFLGISLVLNCLVISLLLVFLNIQNNNIYTDYLTGVYNRKKFDKYLREKIRTSTENKTFSAIMLDMNNFKMINDTMGHNAGDSALTMSIKLLNSCLGANDFIARVGGDEFAIILDISDKNELEEIVQRINNCFKDYNETSNQPYELYFSMGYAVYNYHMSMKMEDFLKQLDLLMYENKKYKKYEIFKR
jgi:diguanylate cyclase (GGDEF)-like protein